MPINTFNITRQRLRNQQITECAFARPEELVAHLGAVQAQDYAAAKWAVGLRLKNITDSAIDKAIDDGGILRTHILRPTWHLVSPKDIRWMLALTAPRINALTAFWYRKLGLDSKIFKRSNNTIAKALRDGEHLTKGGLETALNKAGIVTDDFRLTNLVFRAELDAVICNGARQRKQFTYALLDERVPATKPLQRDEALTELALRYFTSHGPATIYDFAWWSGLTSTDAKKGLEMVKAKLETRNIDEGVLWYPPSAQTKKETQPSVYLLPNYDEYTVGYTGRKDFFDTKHADKLHARRNVLFNNTIVINGIVEGTWKRTLKKDNVGIELAVFNKPSATKKDAIASAANRYAKFLGLKPVLVFK